jgi:hypothetical protein
MIEWKGERLYSLAEAAKILKRTPQEVDDAITRGELKSCTVGGRTMVPEADLQAFLSGAPRPPEDAG